MRQHAVQEGSLSSSHVRGSAQCAAARTARRRILHRSDRALLRGRPGGEPADQMARNAVPVHVDSAGTRRIPVLVRRAFLVRWKVQVDAGSGTRWTNRCWWFGAHHVRHHRRADGAAATLYRRGNGHRRRRHPGAQRLVRHRAAGLRARREDPALSAEKRYYRAGCPRGRCARAAVGRRSKCARPASI